MIPKLTCAENIFLSVLIVMAGLGGLVPGICISASNKRSNAASTAEPWSLPVEIEIIVHPHYLPVPLPIPIPENTAHVEYCEPTVGADSKAPPTRKSAIDLCIKCVKQSFYVGVEIPRNKIRDIFNKTIKYDSILPPDPATDPEFEEKLWGFADCTKWICFAQYRHDTGWNVEAGPAPKDW